jgi:hypothetical protein
VLRREDGRGSLEQVALLAQPQVLTAQPSQLDALIGRDAVVALTAINLVLATPVAQRLLRQPGLSDSSAGVRPARSNSIASRRNSDG